MTDEIEDDWMAKQIYYEISTPDSIAKDIWDRIVAAGPTGDEKAVEWIAEGIYKYHETIEHGRDWRD